MCTSVVAGVDAPPILEPAEHVLDLVAVTIEFAVMFDRAFRGSTSKGCTASNAAFSESPAKPVGIVPLVGEQLPGGRQLAIHHAPRPCNRSSGLR